MDAGAELLYRANRVAAVHVQVSAALRHVVHNRLDRTQQSLFFLLKIPLAQLLLLCDLLDQLVDAVQQGFFHLPDVFRMKYLPQFPFLFQTVWVLHDEDELN